MGPRPVSTGWNLFASRSEYLPAFSSRRPLAAGEDPFEACDGSVRFAWSQRLPLRSQLLQLCYEASQNVQGIMTTDISVQRPLHFHPRLFIGEHRLTIKLFWQDQYDPTTHQRGKSCVGLRYDLIDTQIFSAACNILLDGVTTGTYSIYLQELSDPGSRRNQCSDASLPVLVLVNKLSRRSKGTCTS